MKSQTGLKRLNNIGPGLAEWGKFHRGRENLPRYKGLTCKNCGEISEKKRSPRRRSFVVGREKGDGRWGGRRELQEAGKSVSSSQLTVLPTVLHQRLRRPRTMKIQDRKDQAWGWRNCTCVFTRRVTAQHLKAMRYLYVLIWIHLENMMLSEKSNLQTDT